MTRLADAEERGGSADGPGLVADGGGFRFLGGGSGGGGGGRQRGRSRGGLLRAFDMTADVSEATKCWRRQQLQG